MLTTTLRKAPPAAGPEAAEKLRVWKGSTPRKGSRVIFRGRLFRGGLSIRRAAEYHVGDAGLHVWLRRARAMPEAWMGSTPVPASPDGGHDAAVWFVGSRPVGRGRDDQPRMHDRTMHGGRSSRLRRRRRDRRRVAEVRRQGAKFHGKEGVDGSSPSEGLKSRCK
jgi:hypothetical protein